MRLPRIARLFQYQATTSVIVSDTETVTPDKWYSPFSEPVRSKINPRLAVALIASGLVSPVVYFISPAAPSGGIPSSVTTPVHFRSQLQYQALARPLFVETVTQDKWHRPWSEPVRIKPGLKSYLQDINAYLDQNPDQNLVSKWHQPWSEPLRAKRFAVALQDSVADVPFTQITNYSWKAPWSEPTRRKGLHPSQQDVSADVYFTGEVTSLDKWYQALSEPVRKRGIAAHQQQAYAAPVSTPVAAADIWVSTYSSQIQYQQKFIYQSQTDVPFVPTVVSTDIETSAVSSDVIFPRWRIYQTSAYTPFVAGEVIYEDKWHSAWSEPVRRRGLGPQYQQALAFQPTPVVSFGYYRALSEPVRTKRYPTVQQVQGPVFTPEVIYYDKWGYAWSDPVRTRRYPTSQQAAYFAVPFNEIVTLDKWNYAWSEPVRLRRFPTAEQQAFAFGVPSFEVVTEDKWHFPWSEPVRVRPGLKAHLQDFNAYLDQNPDYQDTESKWHQPWSEPVRFRRLATAQQPGAVWQFFPETVTSDKWNYPWSEPVRTRRFAAALQDSVADIPFNEVVTYDKWGYAWSEPVRFKRLVTAHQPGALWQFAPEVIYEDKWHFPWSEPVRTRRLATAQQQFFTGPVNQPDDPSIESKWHYAWSEPVRSRRISAALQQSALIHSPFFAQEIITLDKWFAAWREPVRVKSGLFAGRQQFTAWSGFTPPPSQASWHRPLTEPVRFRRFPTAEHQSLIWTPFRVEADYRWFNPLSEPVRFRRFPAAEQQTFVGIPFIPDQRIESKWHFAWSEPVRLRRYPLIIPPYAAPLFVIANQVGLVLDATETNNDTAIFAISVYNPAVSCLVSIKEIPPPPQALTSIIEEV